MLRFLFELLLIASNVLVVSLFLYSKLLPHKDRLTGSYKSAFAFIHKILDPVLSRLKKVTGTTQVGNGLFVDMSQIFLLVILLVLINLLH